MKAIKRLKKNVDQSSTVPYSVQERQKIREFSISWNLIKWMQEKMENKNKIAQKK